MYILVDDYFATHDEQQKRLLQIDPLRERILESPKSFDDHLSSIQRFNSEPHVRTAVVRIQTKDPVVPKYSEDVTPIETVVSNDSDDSVEPKQESVIEKLIAAYEHNTKQTVLLQDQIKQLERHIKSIGVQLTVEEQMDDE